MDLLVAASQVLKHDSDEPFMRNEALTCEIAPMTTSAERLKESNVLDAFRVGEYLREKLKNLLECTAKEPTDDCLSPFVKHRLVKDQGHVLQDGYCCVASGCVLLAKGCYLGGRACPEGVAGLESDECYCFAKGVPDEFLVVEGS